MLTININDLDQVERCCCFFFFFGASNGRELLQLQLLAKDNIYVYTYV